jgi:ABC-type multidrug transport system fused ATPase/permease subunit
LRLARAYAARVTGDPAARSTPAWPLLLEHVRPHRRALVGGGLLGLLGGSAALAQPLAAKAVIDALADDASLLRPILVLTGLVVVGALLSAASLFLLERAAEAVVLHARRRLVDVAGLTAVSGVASGLALQVAFLAVLGVGGGRVASGSLDVSSLVAFLLYLFFLAEPIASLTMGATQLQAGLAAVRRMREVEALAVEPARPAGAGAGSPIARAPGGPAEVLFADVRFRYVEHLPEVLRGVGFTAPAGGLTAIVGPSGAGKTTLFALLERFYEPQAGTVAVDGRDVRDWPLHKLRAALGYVEQDAPILAGTLRENLLLAAPRASEEAVRAALARTRLDALVASMPDGLDTRVGSRGTTLSGGERQRVAIAARCCAARACCSWTRRRPSSTRSTSSRCAASWPRCHRPRPCSSWLTGSRPSSRPTASSCSTRAACARWATTTSSSPATSSTGRWRRPNCCARGRWHREQRQVRDGGFLPRRGPRPAASLRACQEMHRIARTS